MKLLLSDIANDSIVDGEGLRFTIFTQGCPHHCIGCHNPQTHSIAEGVWTDLADLIALFQNNPLLDGITLSGGEPFLQPEACAALAKAAHQAGLTVWTYTGYTWETLVSLDLPAVSMLLAQTDILVDGPFLQEERSLELLFRGSRNQRVLDCKKSFQAGTPVCYPIKEETYYA